LTRTRTAILIGIDKFMSECRALINSSARRCDHRDQPDGGRTRSVWPT